MSQSITKGFIALCSIYCANEYRKTITAYTTDTTGEAVTPLSVPTAGIANFVLGLINWHIDHTKFGTYHDGRDAFAAIILDDLSHEIEVTQLLEFTERFFDLPVPPTSLVDALGLAVAAGDYAFKPTLTEAEIAEINADLEQLCSHNDYVNFSELLSLLLQLDATSNVDGVYEVITEHGSPNANPDRTAASVSVGMLGYSNYLDMSASVLEPMLQLANRLHALDTVGYAAVLKDVVDDFLVTDNSEFRADVLRALGAALINSSNVVTLLPTDDALGTHTHC